MLDNHPWYWTTTQVAPSRRGRYRSQDHRTRASRNGEKRCTTNVAIQGLRIHDPLRAGLACMTKRIDLTKEEHVRGNG